MDSAPFQPDMYSAVSVGVPALGLTLADLLSQRQIPRRYLHSLYIPIVAAAWDAEEAAHFANAVLSPVTVDYLVFDVGLHPFPVSERKSRSNSFSILSRCISYACSATMSRADSSFLGRPFGRGIIPAAILLSFLFSRIKSWWTGRLPFRSRRSSISLWLIPWANNSFITESSSCVCWYILAIIIPPWCSTLIFLHQGGSCLLSVFAGSVQNQGFSVWVLSLFKPKTRCIY